MNPEELIEQKIAEQANFERQSEIAVNREDGWRLRSREMLENARSLKEEILTLRNPNHLTSTITGYNFRILDTQLEEMLESIINIKKTLIITTAIETKHRTKLKNLRLTLHRVIQEFQ